MSIIHPKDFATETPPERIIGVECEYNIQLPPYSRLTHYDFVNYDTLNSIGFPNQHGYMGRDGGSGRIYPDVGHLEFDTKESLGPASAAVEDITGMETMADIVNRTGYNHAGLYRLAGTYIHNGRVDNRSTRSSVGRSSGYHENYMLPRKVSGDELIDAVVPTVLATRLWAMNGTLRDDGFVFSQKVWGMGGEPVNRDLLRRTIHGDKPMAIIPTATTDADTIGNDEWARVEVRMADPGLSLVNRYLSFAEMSLALRLVELQSIIGRRAIENLCLETPVLAAKEYAKDLTLKQTATTRAGKTVTALDTQDALLEMFAVLSEKVSLPEDEKLAIVAIQGLTDALRASHPERAEYTTIARVRIDFVPKHQFISEGKPSTLNATNKVAMQRNLLWDNILPAGPGSRYWWDMLERDPLAEQVRLLAEKAGEVGRAALRAQIIDNDNGMEVENWSRFRDPLGIVRSFGNPYGYGK